MTRRTMMGALAAAGAGQGQVCRQYEYRGYDSRLSRKRISADPLFRRATAMEVTRTYSALAIQRELVLISPTGEVTSATADQTIEGLCTDAADQVYARAGGKIYVLREEGLSAVAWLEPLAKHRVFNSGTSSFFVLAESPETTLGIIAAPNGEAAQLLETDQRCGPAHWSNAGLAMVVGDELLRWIPGDEKLVSVFRHASLVGAKSICVLEGGAILLSMPGSLLAWKGGVLTILAVEACLARNYRDKAVVLNGATGSLETIGNFDAVFDPVATEVHRVALEREAAGQGPRSSEAKQELARLIGCESGGL